MISGEKRREGFFDFSIEEGVESLSFLWKSKNFYFFLQILERISREWSINFCVYKFGK